MKRAFTLLVTSVSWLAAAMAIAGCTSPVGSGGGAPTPCSAAGACPGMLQCVNAYCVYVPDSGGGTADTATTDSGAGQDVPATPSDSVAPDPDTGTQIEDLGPVEDAKVVDAVKTDAIKSEDAKDGGGKDVPKADVQALAASIQDIQSAASSQICADSGAIVNSGKVQLSSVVLTVAPTKVKGASGYNTLFYVSPLAAPDSPAYAGVQVMIIGETLGLYAGDVLNLTGEVNEFYCMTQVIANPADVQVIGQAPTPSPYVIPLQQLQPSTAEPYEGDLVAVENVYVSNANVFGSDGKPHAQFAIGPGSGASVVTVALPFGSAMTTKDASGNLMPTVQTGQKFSSITGNVSYSFGVWLLRPRNDADMMP